MRRLLPLALVLALGLAACGGGGPTISKDSLSKLVLTRQDLGRSFAPFSSGPQAPLDNQGTPRTDASRFGREGGWIVRFHRAGSTSTQGPLVVESCADLFGGSGGAKKDLDLYRQMFASSPGSAHRELSPSSLGDEAAGDTFLQPGPKPVRFFRLAWRYENVTAAVTLEGFDGKLTQADALRLARKQQRRLAHASDAANRSAML
jgi:hypothetical protein